MVSVPKPKSNQPITEIEGNPGIANRRWYRFWELLWERTGGSLDKVAQAAPVGTVVQSARLAVPAGWLQCDGSAVSRSTFIELFEAIGSQYGAGDGSTTFNLPDGRGRVFIGAGQGSGLTNRIQGNTGGSETLATAVMTVGAVTVADAGNTDDNMPPFLVGIWLIKT